MIGRGTGRWNCGGPFFDGRSPCEELNVGARRDVSKLGSLEFGFSGSVNCRFAEEGRGLGGETGVCRVSVGGEWGGDQGPIDAGRCLDATPGVC